VTKALSLSLYRLLSLSFSLRTPHLMPSLSLNTSSSSSSSPAFSAGHAEQQLLWEEVQLAGEGVGLVVAP